MKKNCSILVLVLVAMMVTIASLKAQGTNEFTVPLSDPAKRGRLKAQLNYGSITVKGTGRKDVLVKYSAMKEGSDSKSESKDGLKRIGGGGIDLEASENSNTIRIKSDSWNTKMMLEIEVPSGFDLEVSTYNDGDLTITNIQGDLELKNYNGEIKALNISGSVVATTFNGDVKVSFDKVKENTPMSFSTFNGDVDLSLPSTVKTSLKMKTEQGDIYTGFDVTIVSSNPVQQKDTKSGTFKLVVDEWKRAEVNGGGPEFTMQNYNGNIYVRKK
ncbi:MAG: DUF4097 family beta strand repeat protein [Cyclobacteriaceae bacterium]|nr:DUF4097 family beta strand repeat protein [Cyclobacteriaceae bacterium]